MDHGYRARVKEAVDAKVKEYVGSEEFRVMVESLKRRERERILAEVQSEMEVEKKLMITTAREQLQKELNALGILKPSDVLSTTAVTSSSDGGSDAELADVILLRNKQKMEEQQRQEFLRKQAEDARRLEEVLRNKRIEVSWCGGFVRYVANWTRYWTVHLRVPVRSFCCALRLNLLCATMTGGIGASAPGSPTPRSAATGGRAFAAR